MKRFLQAKRRVTATSDKIRLSLRPFVADFWFIASFWPNKKQTKQENKTKNAPPRRGGSARAHGYVVCWVPLPVPRLSSPLMAFVQVHACCVFVTKCLCSREAPTSIHHCYSLKTECLSLFFSMKTDKQQGLQPVSTIPTFHSWQAEILALPCRRHKTPLECGRSFWASAKYKTTECSNVKWIDNYYK